MDPGVYSLETLRTAGMEDREIRANLESGRLRRLRRGWFAGPFAHSHTIAAVTAGGRLGCLSGCARWGIWTPHHGDPHIILGQGRKAPRAVVHRTRSPLPGSAIYPLEDCLEQVARHHDPETTLMVLESAANSELISLGTAQGIIGRSPVHKQRTLEFFDPNAGSGSETRVRLFLQQHRFRVRTQVPIPGVGPVDLVVRDSLIIECDSQAHHAYSAEDRRRDLAAIELGHDVLRLSYAQVHAEWPRTKETLLSVLRNPKGLRNMG